MSIRRLLEHLSALVEGDKKGATHAGVFIPLPAKLADQFPSLGEEDDSPPHITAVFIGELSLEDEHRAVDVLRSVLKQTAFKQFDVEMTDYGEFTNDKGQTIAHMIPRAAPLLYLHSMLRGALESQGFDVAHRKGNFKPHVTLGYMEPKTRYKGPRPQGSWTVPGVEFWGQSKTKIPFSS